MSEKFVKAVKKTDNWKRTENEADALSSTLSALLDLFGTIGALRKRSEDDIQELFENAFNENPLLATKMAFYARNVRGGLGERRTSRVIWRWLAVNHPKILSKNLQFIPFFGRWDDLYTLIGTPVENDMWDLITRQFVNDVADMVMEKPVSLLAKWLKSANASSSETRKLGRLTAKKVGLSEKSYRQYLSSLRKYIDVVERKMSANQWGGINFEHVPSKAMNLYRKAFGRHESERFGEYLNAVEKGSAKIHSDTLFPYDIVEKYLGNNYQYKFGNNIKVDRVLEAQWKALPNYIKEFANIVIVADVSGSMHGRPLATSVGLAIYFAERNYGPFHNLFMTFSARPEFVTLKGKTLAEKIANAANEHWDTNTDIEAAFKKILDVALENNLKQEDLPKALVIVSDMEFDEASQTYDRYSYGRDRVRKTFHQHMSELYRQHGYELPKCIYWNVDARQNTFHAYPEDGVQFASGQSQSVFESLIGSLDKDAYGLMLETLINPVYDVISI